MNYFNQCGSAFSLDWLCGNGSSSGAAVLADTLWDFWRSGGVRAVLYCPERGLFCLA